MLVWRWGSSHLYTKVFSAKADRNLWRWKQSGCVWAVILATNSCSRVASQCLSAACSWRDMDDRLYWKVVLRDRLYWKIVLRDRSYWKVLVDRLYWSSARDLHVAPGKRKSRKQAMACRVWKNSKYTWDQSLTNRHACIPCKIFPCFYLHVPMCLQQVRACQGALADMSTQLHQLQLAGSAIGAQAIVAGAFWCVCVIIFLRITNQRFSHKAAMVFVAAGCDCDCVCVCASLPICRVG